jgi:hypothetical protein
MRGKRGYIPKMAAIELEDIKKEFGFKKNRDAFEAMVLASQFGRKIRRISCFDKGHQPISYKKLQRVFR